MPVIRFPNFTDRTGDVTATKFFVRVGNHRNTNQLETVSLTDVLRNIKTFSAKPGRFTAAATCSRRAIRTSW